MRFAAAAALALTSCSVPQAESAIPREERAIAARTFVDSIGMNIHLPYADSPYGKRMPEIERLLVELGVRHVRDASAPGNAAVCAEDRRLAQHGIRLDAITDVAQPPPAIAAWASCVGSALEAFEGPNEFDVSHNPTDADWGTTLRRYQQTLYAAVRSLPDPVPVIGPSATSEAGYRRFGDLAGSMDIGNTHNYFSGFNPGTGGWGGTNAFGTYGSLKYDLAIAAQTSQSHTVYCTETGYGDAPADPGNVPFDVESRYTLRAFLESWNAGIRRTYRYELVDWGTPPYSSYGLVTTSLASKPAFHALASFIRLLDDRGPAFSPSRLAYSIQDVSPEVHHLLLQKRDRSFWLAAWIEAPGYDVNAKRETPVAPVTATVRFDAPVSRLLATTISDDGRLTRTALAPSRSVRLALSDRVTILRIVPGHASRR